EIKSVSSIDSIINSNYSDISENIERDQNDTIIAPFQESNESSSGMTLPLVMYGPLSGTTTSQLPSNIPLYVQLRQLYLRDRRQYDKEENDTYASDYEQNILFEYVNDDDKTLQGISFFNNANELERGRTPSRIPRRVTFNTTSILSSNHSSRPSNLRVTTPSVGNTNSGSSLGNPYNFSQATQYSPVGFESNSSNRGNNTIGHQNVTTKGTPQSTTSVPSSQPSNNINTSQPILTPQLAIVPVGGNNNNAYLQVIQGLTGWLQGQ
ncbi:7612_t:CDS:2, partial [Funneliformis caledonium]